MYSPQLPYSCTLPSGAMLRIEKICSPNEVTEKIEGGSQHRQCERFTWHRAARTILGNPSAQFSYNAIGAPQIVNSNLHISVSHSATLVAVIISPQPCAIDIESLSRNFERVASRYQSPSELKFPLETLWSIKEALYKFACRKELNLLNDIKVTSLNQEHFEATITPNNHPIHGTVTQIFDHTLSIIVG